MNLISENRFLEITKLYSSLAPILVVGDVGIDKYTYGEVVRISPEAPVPVLEVTKEWMKLGLAANISDNLKSLEVDSTLCGVVGNDRNASLLENLLEERKLKIWGLLRDESRPTTFKERLTTNTQQICRVDYESKIPISADYKNKLISRVEEFKAVHSSLIIEDYGKGIFDEHLCQYLISAFTEMGKIVAIDASRYTPPKWYRGATILKPNFSEAKSMCEQLGYFEESVEKIAEILVDKLNIEKLVITLGAKGMAYIDTKISKTINTIPTVAKEVFDVSGAGDTAVSAIVASMVAGANLEEACWIANCASGVVVGKKGTALVSKSELKSFYENLKKNYSH